ALHRFTYYVPRALAEPLMFCHCAAHDEECLEQQSLFYPKCLYSSSAGSQMRTCKEVVDECRTDPRCNQLRYSVDSVCPVSKGSCATDQLDHCRQTLLRSRGSLLESPCFCPISDMECLSLQNTMIPNNPCIEKAMLDYSRIMGYMKPQRAHVDTNRVQATDEDRKVEYTERPREPEPRRRPEITAAPKRTRPTTTTTTTTTVKPTMHVPKKQKVEERKPKTTPTSEADDDVLVTRPDPQLEYTKIGWVFGQDEPERRQNMEAQEDRSSETTREQQLERQKQRTQELLHAMREKEERAKAERHRSKAHPTEPEPTADSSSEGAEAVKDAERLQKTIPRQKAQRTTTAAPRPGLTSSERPPWISTTPTTEPKTTEYVTIAPPATQDNCSIKHANGKDLFVHVGAIVRKYTDWAGRCSTWCECTDVEQLNCEKLDCHEDSKCPAPLTKMEFGDRLYLQGRGACMCENAVFVCDTPEEPPEVRPGLYIFAGYSLADLELLRKNIEHDVLERAGMLSSDFGKDIAAQLQWALERQLPETLKCRIVMQEGLVEEGNVIYQIELLSDNMFLNDTKVMWRSDGVEKACSSYVRRLVDSFALDESPRFQLILSTVKQLRFVDTLDALPVISASTPRLPLSLLPIMLLLNTLRFLRW
ncbi:unnamed protein product, partial [Mesorhabditis spiculigera]